MTFKEMIERDRREVFLNLDEFAETHSVDGKNISVSIDADALTAKQQALGVDSASLVLFAASEDLPKRKPPGAAINVDGRDYIVVDWADNKGVTQITLLQTVGM